MKLSKNKHIWMNFLNCKIQRFKHGLSIKVWSNSSFHFKSTFKDGDSLLPAKYICTIVHVIYGFDQLTWMFKSNCHFLLLHMHVDLIVWESSINNLITNQNNSFNGFPNVLLSVCIQSRNDWVNGISWWRNIRPGVKWNPTSTEWAIKFYYNYNIQLYCGSSIASCTAVSESYAYASYHMFRLLGPCMAFALHMLDMLLR